MIDVPALISIELANATKITGTFARYSDPARATYDGAFVAVAADGSTHYTLWAAIARVSVWPLATSPQVPDAA